MEASMDEGEYPENSFEVSQNDYRGKSMNGDNGYGKSGLPRFIGNQRKFESGARPSAPQTKINNPSFLRKLWNQNSEQGYNQKYNHNSYHNRGGSSYQNFNNEEGRQYNKRNFNGLNNKRPRGYTDIDDPSNTSLLKEEGDKENSSMNAQEVVAEVNAEGTQKFQKRPNYDGDYESKSARYSYPIFKKEPQTQLLEKITEDEMGLLLENWRGQQFIPFNSWIQITKSSVQYQMIENQKTAEFHTGNTKSFVCHAQLSFGADSKKFDPVLVGTVNSVGLGRKKKEAKSSATEKLVIELFSKGLLEKGLRNKGFLNGKKLEDELSSKMKSEDPNKDENLEERIAKKMKNLSKKMQAALKTDDFLEACANLSRICELQRPTWNEVSFIWCYALLKKNVEHILIILEILHRKKVPKKEQLENLFSENVYESCEGSQKIKNELSKLYGNLRIRNDNSYEIYDLNNVELNYQEIAKEYSITANEEEHEKELVRDPFSRPITELLTLNTLAEKRFVQSSLGAPGGYPHISTLRLSNANSLKPEQQMAQQKGGSMLIKMQDEFYSDEYYNNKLDPHSKKLLKANKDSDPQQNIEKFSFNSNSHDCSINHSLLNMFYDSLYYIGDPNFCLRVAEILYYRVRLNPKEFILPEAAEYYAHKRNLLIVEFLELIFQIFNRDRPTKMPSDFIFSTSISGSLEHVGSHYAEDVVWLSPNALPENLESKLLKKYQLDGRENNQIAEGEFVMLTSFFKPTFEKPFLKESPSQLANYINAISRNTKENHTFINSITEFGNTIEFATIACVREIAKDFKIKMFIMLTKEEQEGLVQQGRVWKITKLLNRQNIDRTARSLLTFCTKNTMSNLLQQLLLATPYSNSHTLNKVAQTKVGVKSQNSVNTNLNRSQESALKMASSQVLTLIQGPPGTGKTITMVEIIAEWLRQTPHKILACTESNIAADLLHSELQRAGVRSMRVGTGMEEKFENPNGFKDVKMASNLYGQKKFSSGTNTNYLQILHRIRNADVICTTCLGANSDYLLKLKFPRVIIDEANRILEILSLVPLIKNCQQMVLLGDENLMPPNVSSLFAQSKGMGISLFEKLIRLGVETQFLDVQYKLHNSLVKFPQEYIYRREIKSEIEEETRPIVFGFPWPNEEMRLAFVHAKGFEQIYNNSLQNTKEVTAVTEILLQILKAGYIRVNAIGILTAYDAQKKKIKNEIIHQAKKYPNLFGLTLDESQRVNRNSILCDVETVDSYKGFYKDLLIFSTVRSNSQGNLGLLKDPRRLNSVIERSKRGLIIIGDMDTLSNDVMWRDFFYWSSKNKLIMNYN